MKNLGSIVLQGLVQLGHQQSLKNDVKSMANTWKHVSKLAIDFRIVHRTVQQQNQMEFNEDLLDWITYSVHNICDLIKNNVHDIIQVNIIDFINSFFFSCKFAYFFHQFQPSKSHQEMTTVLKITSFYLKILQNLAKEYMNDEFRGQKHFIQLFEMVADARYVRSGFQISTNNHQYN